jgi:hypothetical protein
MNDDTERQARVDAWAAGTPLNQAWFKFGDDRQRRQQIERRGTPASLAIQDLMVADLFGRLFGREFIARGYRVAPTPSDGPVVVPPDMFSERPATDPSSNDVSASGYVYERVTIAPSTEANSSPRAAEIDVSRAERERPGPKGTYETAKLILRGLFEEQPGRGALAAAKLLDAFNDRYVADAKAMGVKAAGLNERTLRNHLKRYRAEKTGKDRND